MVDYQVREKMKKYPNINVYTLAGMSGWTYFDDEFLSSVNSHAKRK
jgi:hypothetical protein